MHELKGFALSQEELLAALRLAGLSAPLGADELEQTVLEDFSSDQLAAVLAIAERSMLAHGLVDYTDTGPVLEPLVASWLATICQPQETWVMLHQPVGQRQQAWYAHRSTTDIVLHHSQGGIHQLIRLDSAEAIASTAYELVTPLDAPVAALYDARIPENVFRALASSRIIDAAATIEQLQSVGFDPALAATLTESFVALRSITACARIVFDPDLGVQQAFTLVCGQNTQWVLVPETSTVLRLHTVDAAMIQRLLATFVAPLEAN